MRITKASPGSAPGGYHWDHAGAVVEVDDKTANAILTIKDADFAPAPEVQPEAVEDKPRRPQRRVIEE